MFIKTETILSRKLIGLKLSMTLSNDLTSNLFRTFMPRKKEIINALDTNVYCLQQFELNLDYSTPNNTNPYIKWAAVAVSDFINIPSGMEAIELSGLYAVFQHTGPSTSLKTLHYIYGEWLPNSNYTLDDRTHFEIMGSDYQPMAVDAKEEVWKPIKIR